MQFRRTILVSSAILFLVALCWGMLFVSRTILNQKSNNNLNHIPQNARFVMRIDTRELVKKSLFSVFLESRDEDAVNLIQESFTKRLQKSGEGKDDGIDYFSDILLFEIPFKSEHILGVLVNLTNSETFNQQMSSSSFVYAWKDDVGVVFIDQLGLQQKHETSLRKLAKSIVENSQKVVYQKWDHKRKSGQFFDTESHAGFWTRNTYFGHSSTHFNLYKRSLTLRGAFELNEQRKSEVQPIHHVVKPNGFHFSSALLPKTVNDSIQHWLHKFSVNIPPIQQISMNYRGIKIDTYSDGFSIVPQIELTLVFNKPTNIKAILATKSLSSNFNYSVQSNFIAFQHERLYFKQLTPYSFYLGVSSEPQIIPLKRETFLSIKGKLNALVTVDGGGLMASFLEMLPIYLASKNLATKTEFINIQVYKKLPAKAILDGELRFTEDSYPMNELIKFLLVSQLVE